MKRVARVLVHLVIALVVGCTGSSDPVETDILDGAGAAPDLVDVMRLSEVVGVDGAPDVWSVDVRREDGGADRSDFAEGPQPGEAGYPCQSGDDCLTGFCIDTGDGRLCTSTCVDECPFGWACQLHTPSRPDQVYLCVPTDVDLCRPCAKNTDCWADGIDAGQACVVYGSVGAFCGAGCQVDGDCPDGYVCGSGQDVTGADVQQCLLLAGDCKCTQRFVDAQATTNCFQSNASGTCAGTRACSASGLSPCDAKVPSDEVCNGTDDDCDLTVDEGQSGGDCLVSNGAGSCPGAYLCEAGVLTCDGPEPAPELCDGKDNDCDGDVDENFPDTDQDGIADCLESDVDGDGTADLLDNCPATPNPAQEDFDLDTVGDACDPDDDNDKSADTQDCAPKNDAIYPGAVELCDGLDNDCDLVVDEGFYDFDGDGYKNCVDDDDDADGILDQADCQPLDGTVYPGAKELCDGKDNDCDQDIDDGFPDADGDGIADCVDEDGDGDGVLTVDDNCAATPNPEQEDMDGDGLGDVCDLDADGDAIPDAVDNCLGLQNALQLDADEDGLGDLCDDDVDGDGVVNSDDNCVHVANNDQADQDDDGVGDACEDDLDGDGVVDGKDCAPDDPGIYPGAQEACDGVDNNCNALIDEGFIDTDFDLLKDCVDGDDDNDGDPDGSDCAPLSPAIFKGALELCNGLDDDCDGKVDEDLGVQSCGKGGCFHEEANCANGLKVVCDPLAGIGLEVCDGIDNDCDGLTDEELGTSSCGEGVCAHTVPNCQGGQTVACDPLSGAGEEVCDNKDNDCDGKIDEEQPTLACGKGQCFHSTPSCIGGVTYECNAFQGASKEVCDGQDNDCDGEVDEDLGTVSCGKGQCQHEQAYCQDGKVWPCDPFLGAELEVCDLADNDCDGLADEELGTYSCGQGSCAHPVKVCENGQPGECDPFLGALEESCDGVDNDCDGDTDEGLGIQTCGVGPCEHSEEVCANGQKVICDPLLGAVEEICFDTIDNDCNGEADEIADCSFVSCKAIHASYPALSDGVYTIDPDGDGGTDPFQVYCDMTTDGGGWTLIMKLSKNEFCYGSTRWTDQTPRNADKLLDTVMPSTQEYDAKSAAFHLIDEVTSLRFATSKNAAVTVSFASPATPETLMTTNDVPFSPYPDYQTWRAAFGHDRQCGPVFMRAGVSIMAGSCRTSLAAPQGCGQPCTFCFQAADGNYGCKANPGQCGHSSKNDVNSGVGNHAGNCGGGIPATCSAGGQWSTPDLRTLVWAR